MRSIVALLLITIGFGGYAVTQNLPTVDASNHSAAVLTIDGTIDPISSDFLSRGIETAKEDRASLLVVQLDTPGGTLEATREMVENILASPVPIVVYVNPPGAQAASAGTFVTSAAHIAAMSPSTNIGAASPVASGGDDLPETIKSKITQDTAALLRSISEERNRNTDALEKTVLDATSYTATEALDQNIIDIVARDMNDLLTQLDGKSVTLPSGQVILDTQGITVSNIERIPVEKFLAYIANPNFAFLLLTIGGIGILLEFLSPGLIGPGAIGVIALALAFLAFGNLPVNWVGVGLIILAMGLFFLEAQAPGVGVFGVSGAISFVLGAFLLFGGLTFDPEPPPLPGAPSFRVSMWLIGGVTVLMFASLILTFKAMRDAKQSKTYTSSQETSKMVGQIGVVTSPLNPRGTVQVAGELWSAESDDGQTIPDGEKVIVLESAGLTLKVFMEKDKLGEMQDDPVL